MHTPDGFLTSWVCVVTLIISASIFLYAAKTVGSKLTRTLILKMGLAAGIIFAFQMLNFPIASGTSGHFLGAGLAAILFGWEAAVIVMSVVLSIQALVYGDGGVLAIGANVLNMAIVAPIVTRTIYDTLSKKNKTLAVALSSTIGVIAAAASASILLWVSNTYSLIPTLTAMISNHLVIGLAEAGITIGVFYAINASFANFRIHHVAYAFILSIFILAIGLPLVSTSPDGLESVAISLGFYESATPAFTYSLMPDYTMLGSGSYIMVLIAGIVGIISTFGATIGTSRLLQRFA